MPRKKKKKKKTSSRRRKRSVITRSRKRGSSKITLNVSGLKKAFDINALLAALAGALTARAASGGLVKAAPTIDPKIRAILAALGVGIGGIVISGKPKHVIPITVGAGAMTLLDILAPYIAPMLQQHAPEVAQAILAGAATPIYPGYAAPVANAGVLTDYWDTGNSLRSYNPNRLSLPKGQALSLGDIDFVHH